MAHPQSVKNEARNLYLLQWSCCEIARKLKISDDIVYKWSKDDQWDDLCPPDNVTITVSRRLNLLANKENKTGSEIKEFEALCRTFGKMQVEIANAEKIKAEARFIANHGALPVLKIDRNNNKTETADGGEKQGKSRKKAVKNDISSITPERLDEVLKTVFYDYQRLWYERKNDPATRRTRFILKSRQIGATYYFAFEALDDAIRNNENQIFLSASRDQAEVFKSYIIAFAKEHFDVELKGTGVILLSNGAELRFLSTNSTTSQSYHGHLYIDEVFWIPKFEKVNKTASGIAAHKKWRKTYFSTPSSQSHPAYDLWTGKHYNSRFTESKRVEFDVSHKSLKNGALGADKIWRHIVTVEDAEKQGCDLFDIAELRIEYRPSEFDNLFMCRFIDDSQSVFGWNLLESCLIHADAWDDYHPKAAQPFGNRAVSFGFDPSKTGDGSALAILDIPATPSQPFRLLDKHKFYGKNFTWQANAIYELVQKHNVIYFAADNTGGTGVTMCEKVLSFYPLLTTFFYSPQIKAMLIGKALDLMTQGRFKYLACHTDVTQAFLMISETTTASGNAITYNTKRVAASDAGTAGYSDHSDIAWAIMHAFQHEPITPRRETSITFSD